MYNPVVWAGSKPELGGTRPNFEPIQQGMVELGKLTGQVD